MKRIVSLILMLVLCLSLCPSSIAATVYQEGDRMMDFTVKTFDGKEINLYDTLKEKELVMINIWASWCGACESEFPYMQEAYLEYMDRIEIIALSCEPSDTNSVIKEFANERGLTFPMAQDTVSLAALLNARYIPTTAIVNKDGNILYIESAAMSSYDEFRNLFEAFLQKEPNVDPSSREDVKAALNAENADLLFTGDADKYAWPMTVSEKDGKTVVVSRNTGVPNSYAAVNTVVESKAGDVLLVEFKTSTESMFDLMKICIDNTVVKVFGGEHDWMSYAYPFETEGKHKVQITYVKNMDGNAGEDCIWIDTICVVPASGALDALDRNPEYPVHDEFSLSVGSPEARKVVIDDPSGVLEYLFGDFDAYVLNADQAEFSAALTADIDPEIAFLFSDYDTVIRPLASITPDENGFYSQVIGVDSMDTTGYPYTNVYLFSDPALDPVLSILYFRDIENLEGLLALASVDEDNPATWMYEEEALEAIFVDETDEASYTITYVDQNGDPVSGVMVQVCDETVCTVFTTDENGMCVFTLAPSLWQMHTLMLPSGYTGDTETVTTLSPFGDTLEFVIEKQ